MMLQHKTFLHILGQVKTRNSENCITFPAVIQHEPSDTKEDNTKSVIELDSWTQRSGGWLKAGAIRGTAKKGTQKSGSECALREFNLYLDHSLRGLGKTSWKTEGCPERIADNDCRTVQRRWWLSLSRQIDSVDHWPFIAHGTRLAREQTVLPDRKIKR